MGPVAEHARLYSDLWSSLPAYAEHSPGAVQVPLFLAMTGATSGTVLDAGCGSGKGALALTAAGFDVLLCDLTPDGLVADALGLPFIESSLWHLSCEGVDFVYCCDVLEHVPTEYTMLVLHRLLSVAREGVFLSISLVPDSFGVWVGRHLHETVRDFCWWRDRLNDLGTVAECRDLGASGVYFVRPR